MFIGLAGAVTCGLLDTTATDKGTRQCAAGQVTQPDPLGLQLCHTSMVLVFCKAEILVTFKHVVSAESGLLSVAACIRAMLLLLSMCC